MQPRFTINEIAERLGVGREDARGLVKFLSAVDLAVKKGERSSEGRGKPENVYEFVDGFEKVAASMMIRAKLS